MWPWTPRPSKSSTISSVASEKTEKPEKDPHQYQPVKNQSTNFKGNLLFHYINPKFDVLQNKLITPG